MGKWKLPGITSFNFSSFKFIHTYSPFFVSQCHRGKLSFLSPINAIVFWHRCRALVTQWGAKHIPSEILWSPSVGKTHLCSDPILVTSEAGPPGLQHTQASAIFKIPSSQRDHRSLGSTIWPLKGWSISCLCVFSFHLLLKPPNLTSASTIYIGKAVVENTDDCVFAEPSTISPVLTLLDPSELFSTLASSL